MTSQDYLKDISEIKDIMKKSSRFMSLSGLSGILAGIFALAGAFYILSVLNSGVLNFQITYVSGTKILFTLAIVAFLSIVSAIYLTTQKAKKDGLPAWDGSSKRMILNFLVPLVTGGLLILINLIQEQYDHIASLMLIFYGLALVSASKYTLGDIRILGYLEIAIGLVCALMPEYGIYLWAIGFGVLHIIYGSWMHIKYK